MFLPCLSSCPHSFRWWTLVWKCVWYKPFAPRVAYGHGFTTALATLKLSDPKSLTWNSPSSWGWLGSKSKGSALFCLSISRVASVYHHTLLFYVGFGVPVLIWQLCRLSSLPRTHNVLFLNWYYQAFSEKHKIYLFYYWFDTDLKNTSVRFCQFENIQRQKHNPWIIKENFLGINNSLYFSARGGGRPKAISAWKIWVQPEPIWHSNGLIFRNSSCLSWQVCMWKHMLV
jgi:hypothetical protein